MRLLTGYAALAVPLAPRRSQAGSRRALWVAALSIFAVSALHLSQFHQAIRRGPWSYSAITSLPLAIAILIGFSVCAGRLFLKRALMLVVVSAAFVSSPASVCGRRLVNRH